MSVGASGWAGQAHHREHGEAHHCERGEAHHSEHGKAHHCERGEAHHSEQVRESKILSEIARCIL